jgi:peptidoglycan/LPS O-acetylase OafA/YrhL
MSAPKERLAGLDALRGYAAIAVMLMHASVLLDAPWLMPSGFLAVDLFFLMSGFVIAHSYDAKIPSMGIWGFLKVRVIRFYPLLLLGLGLGALRAAILVLRGQSTDGMVLAFGANLLFLPAPPSAFSAGSISPFDGPAWSLFFELWINALYALLLPRLSSKVLAALVCCAGAGLGYLAVTRGNLGGGVHWPEFAIGVARVSFSFPFGVLLFRWRNALPDLSRLGLLVAPVLLAYFMLPPSALHDLAFVVIVSPVLVIVALRGGAWEPLAAYGAAASYALYAIHFPLFELLSGATHSLRIDPVLPTAGLIVSLLVACPLLDRFYDRPIRRLLGASRRQAAQQDAAP